MFYFRYATSRHQRSNSGVTNNAKGNSNYTNSLPRHISLYNNNNDNEDTKESQKYNNEGKFHFPIQQLFRASLDYCHYIVSLSQYLGQFGGQEILFVLHFHHININQQSV